MAILNKDKYKEYARFASHCLDMVAVTGDQESRSIQREMAAEWLDAGGCRAPFKNSDPQANLGGLLSGLDASSMMPGCTPNSRMLPSVMGGPWGCLGFLIIRRGERSPRLKLRQRVERPADLD
jgi:hypothetical protein